jgi:hypothetical protein
LSEKKNIRPPGNVLKVIELGLQDRVYDAMRSDRFSVDALTRELNAEGVKITAQSIRKFIKKTKGAQRELIAKDIRAANELVKLTMDYQKALKDILAEVDEVKNTVREQKDYSAYNQLVGRLMQGIELIAKITGDIKPSGHTDVKIIYNEINNNMEKTMKDVRKELFGGLSVIDVDAEICKDDKMHEEELKE